MNARTIREAAEHSRGHDTIGAIRMDDWAQALSELRECVDQAEEYDYVENGDVLEFWAYVPTTTGSMTMRVHVVRSGND